MVIADLTGKEIIMKKLILFSILFCFVLGGLSLSQSSAEDGYEEGPKPPCPIGEFCFCFPAKRKYDGHDKLIIEDGKENSGVTECTHIPSTLFSYLQLVEEGLITCGECDQRCRNNDFLEGGGECCDDEKFLTMEPDDYGECKDHLFEPFYGGEEDWDWEYDPYKRQKCEPEALTFCVLPKKPHYDDDYKYNTYDDGWRYDNYEPMTVTTAKGREILELARGVCRGKVLTGPCPVKEPPATGDDGGSATGGDTSGDTGGSTDGGSTGSTQEIPIVSSDGLSGSGCSLNTRTAAPYAATALLLLVPIAVAGLLRRKPSA